MMRCCSSHKILANENTKGDIFHISPSKLTKKELENVYYELLETSLDLKKTVSEQSEKLKCQATKVQRLVNRGHVGFETKECCAVNKTLLQEYKHEISELKLENDKLKEQIKHLNMRLCSAKQFTRRNLLVKNHNKSIKGSNVQIKSRNASTTTLNFKPIGFEVDSKEETSQDIDILESSRNSPKQEVTSHRSEINQSSPSVCKENICKTSIEVLKHKLTDLAMELTKAHEEYATRIAQLENEIAELKSENLRLKNENTCKEEDIKQRIAKEKDMKKKLIEQDNLNQQLTVDLFIARNRIAELETEVKAAILTIDTFKRMKSTIVYDQTKNSESQFISETIIPKTGDDSGCADDINKSVFSEAEACTSKENEDLIKKVAQLQAQFDDLKGLVMEKGQYFKPNKDVERPIPEVRINESYNKEKTEKAENKGYKNLRDNPNIPENRINVSKLTPLKQENENTPSEKKSHKIKIVSSETGSLNDRTVIQNIEDDIHKSGLAKNENNSDVSLKTNDTNHCTDQKDEKERAEILRSTEIQIQQQNVSEKETSKFLENETKLQNTRSKSHLKEKNMLQEKIQLTHTNSNIEGNREINKPTDKSSPSSGDMPRTFTKKTDHRLVAAKNEQEREPNTYTIPPGVVLENNSRATSPDNTDKEISSLTDLPSERDSEKKIVTVPLNKRAKGMKNRYDRYREQHSLGEYVATETFSEATSTSSLITTAATQITLSEGEMPLDIFKSSRKKSVTNIKSKYPQHVKEPKSAEVEKTLAAINEEMVRCRRLLEKPFSSPSFSDNDFGRVRIL